MNIPFDSRLFVTLLLLFVVLWWFRQHRILRKLDPFPGPGEPIGETNPPDQCQIVTVQEAVRLKSIEVAARLMAEAN